jgi:hypothetical protein
LISRKNRISFARVKESFSGLYPKVEPRRKSVYSARLSVPWALVLVVLLVVISGIPWRALAPDTGSALRFLGGLGQVTTPSLRTASSGL